MATITAFIRAAASSQRAITNVRFRLTDGRKVQLFHKSDIKVSINAWDPKKEQLKAKILIDADKRMAFNNAIVARKELIANIYHSRPYGKEVTSDWLNKEIYAKLDPNSKDRTGEENDLFKVLDNFIATHEMSLSRQRQYLVIKRMLMRYRAYRRIADPRYELSFELSTDEVYRIKKYLKDEYMICEQYPFITEAAPDTREIKQRGPNTLYGLLIKMSSFFNYAIREGHCKKNPFSEAEKGREVYGTPYYISLEERDKILRLDLSAYPALAAQRDIFIFQCLIGCRVGNLLCLCKDNVINEAVEYIPKKTKGERPITIRVPLNSKAKAILERYKELPGAELLPFISAQKYNCAIKKIFNLAGLTRMVTILNPTTGIEERRQLDEIASSHLARRTFIGNLYSRVKDPSQVGALSGHKEGSRAFARYRDIDETQKRELVEMID